jgi:hypothetical protein
VVTIINKTLWTWRCLLGLWHHLVWYICRYISEEHVAYIMRVDDLPQTWRSKPSVRSVHINQSIALHKISTYQPDCMISYCTRSVCINNTAWYHISQFYDNFKAHFMSVDTPYLLQWYFSEVDSIHSHSCKIPVPWSRMCGGTPPLSHAA